MPITKHDAFEKLNVNMQFHYIYTIY